MSKTIIDDPLGIDSVIRIKNVRCLLDRDGDRIMITGRMSGDRIAGLFNAEPDIQCEIVDQKDQICLSACSVHDGIFSYSGRAAFTVLIESVSRSVAWDSIETIRLYLIYRRSSMCMISFEEVRDRTNIH